MKIWNQMTWEEIDKLNRNTLLILPAGSIEQHGQRLTVDTDTYVAAHLAMALAEKITDSVLLPLLNYGMSWHHTAFPGTLSLSPATYTQVIRDILESIAKHGFRRILIVSAHGGNDKWIDKAITEIQESYKDIVISNPLIKLLQEDEFKKLADEFGEDIVHAGAMETSQFWAIDSDDSEKASWRIRRTEVVTEFPTGAKWGEGTESPEAWKEKFPMGQKGDQVTNVSIEKGKRVNEFIVARLLEVAKKMME